MAEGSRISSLHRAKGHKEDTILAWLREAGQYAEQLEGVLMKNFKIKCGQLDALWACATRVKKSYPETTESGQFMHSTMLDMDSRLRVAQAIEKDETRASIAVFRTLQQSGYPDAPPPTISDGWGGIDEAIVEVYGLVPEYGGRGRPPTRKKPGPNWIYLQMVK